MDRSQRNKFNVNPVGSVELYIRNELPGQGKEANWPPAPRGNFILMMRPYCPKRKDRSILNGTREIPPVAKVGAADYPG
jgi:hypothetical protein